VPERFSRLTSRFSAVNSPDIITPKGSGDAVSAHAIAEHAQHLALFGASVNAALSAIKILTGAFGHSYALIADGMESGLDVASSLVIWGGLRYAAKSPDADHPYGHGKAEPISALLVSSFLTGAALVLAGLSVREILSPHRALPSWITLAVLVVVIVVKESLFRRVYAVGTKIASAAVRTDAWHHRADAITSVAAFTGILIARVGGPACASADAWAALFACAIIGFNGYRLMLPAIAEIMDTAPDPEIERRVRDAAAGVAGVAAVEKCRVRKMGLDFYVDLHVGVDGLLTVAAGHQIAHEVKDAVRAAEHRVADVLVHVEPENVSPYPGLDPRP
jgi:cation diffusion facilitator family transporter